MILIAPCEKPDAFIITAMLGGLKCHNMTLLTIDLLGQPQLKT